MGRRNEGRPEKLLEEAVSEGRSVEEYWLVRKDGSRFLAETITTALHDHEDNLSGFSAVRLMVSDKERGFRPDEATKGNGPGERICLSGMHERLSLLGGRFQLNSEPASDTMVTAKVEVPTNREDSDDAG